jgi:hypothetical protein
MKCPTAIFEEIGTDQLIRVVRGSIGYLVRIGQEGLGGPRTHMGMPECRGWATPGESYSSFRRSQPIAIVAPWRPKGLIPDIKRPLGAFMAIGQRGFEPLWQQSAIPILGHLTPNQYAVASGFPPVAIS